MIFDYEVAYIGSAKLAGAEFGMKGTTTRNFEADNSTRRPCAGRILSLTSSMVYGTAYPAKNVVEKVFARAELNYNRMSSHSISGNRLNVHSI